eukprot:3337378-Rhodomonas_salina.1
MQPAEWQGRIIQFSILEPVLTRKQVAQGLRKDYVWWIRKMLDINHNEPTTLADIGLSSTMVEHWQVNQTLLNLWCGAPTLSTPQLRDKEMGESSPTGEQTQPELD